MIAPSLRDPVGLVERCPELAELAERSPALHRAIEQGRPLDAYRALFWAHKTRRFGHELRDVAATLLSHRRIFLKALTRAPVMFTYNGLGTRLYDQSDIDLQDGTYVATLYLVFFYLPIFPLTSYLVRASQEKPGRAWSFLAKVPLSAPTHVWQRAGALAVLALIGFGVVHAFAGYRNNMLYVANGLDRAVTVDVEGSPRFAVASQSQDGVTTTAGKHRLVVRDGNRIVEETTVDVPHAHVTTVWNILGAAPVVVAPVVYASSSSGHESSEKPEILCGKELLARQGVDYAFIDPPKSIDSSRSSGSILKWHLTLVPGGAQACLAYFLQQGDALDAGRLGMRIARALELPASALDGATHAALAQVPTAEAEEFVKELLGRDDSVEAHRIYQDVLLETNQRGRAIREYDARLAEHPGSADAEYLALRVKPLEEEKKAIDAVLARYPSHPFLLRAHIFVHFAERDFEGALASAEKLRALRPEDWRAMLVWNVDALVALGRGAEAVTVLHALHDDPRAPAPDRREAGVLAFRVERLLAKKPGDPELPNVPESPGSLVSVASFAAPTTQAPLVPNDGDDGWSSVFARASAGLRIPGPEIDRLKDDDRKVALVITTDARTDPRAAIARVKSSDPIAVAQLPASVTALLLAEAVRVGDQDAVHKLGGMFGRRLVEAIAAYVHSGTLDEPALDLPLELQAALHLARSRVSDLSPKERSECLARAKQADLLEGPVTVAIRGWTS